MTKKELVKSLKNVKIVFGNGADLYCGLKTRYSDYFEPKKQYYERIITTYQKFKNICDVNAKSDYLFFRLKSDFGFYPYLVKNIWDVLFCLSFTNNVDDVLWCDIEKKMHDSFTKKDIKMANLSYFSRIHWDEVSELVHGYKYNDKTRIEELFVAMVSNIICDEKQQNGYYNFYRFLKNELIRFEHSFGEYISKETAYNTVPHH